MKRKCKTSGRERKKNKKDKTGKKRERKTQKPVKVKLMFHLLLCSISVIQRRNLHTTGGDDRRVLLWNIQEALSLDKKFEVMIGEHHSNIFSLAFDSHNSRIYSGGNDDQVLVHDIQR